MMLLVCICMVQNGREEDCVPFRSCRVLHCFGKLLMIFGCCCKVAVFSTKGCCRFIDIATGRFSVGEVSELKL